MCIILALKLTSYNQANCFHQLPLKKVLELKKFKMLVFWWILH